MSTSHPEYEWKIPSITDEEKYILCHGFCRKEFDKYIIDPIIQLFSKYLILDEHDLNEMLNASINGQLYRSPLISLNSLKLYLEFYPNGISENSDG